MPLPGAGEPADRAAAFVASLSDAATPLEQRQLAAMVLGHLADASPRHWSARLARSIDYRSPTPVLLGPPNGVLRLP
ncbi:MAG TPA: hypothetical protein VFZ65_01425 [Planctomycetota bacterium]|nr:hypothetical protein [Planctomycetota bacterium]